MKKTLTQLVFKPISRVGFWLAGYITNLDTNSKYFCETISKYIQLQTVSKSLFDALQLILNMLILIDF